MNKVLKIIIVLIVLLILLFIAFMFYINIMTRTNNNKKSISNNTISNNSLVLYFSVTNNTKHIAEYIKELTNSDIYEIVPKDKYTNEDIDYNNNNSRANKEQNDINARPKINNMTNLEKYDTIYLGYPIWWGDVPKIILTLIDENNLSNKKIILFCTSGSSGIENSINTLKNYNKNINIIDGKRFSASTSKEEVKEWLNTLNIVRNKEMIIEINNKELTVKLEDNSSTKELLNKLEKENIEIDASDYSNFEKVGDLGFNLPTSDKNITTTPGDIVLYQGNKIVLFYGSNTWDYTKLGHIKNINTNELKELLGNNNIKIILKKG